MSEIIALTRFALSRHRLAIILLVALALIGECAILASVALSPTWDQVAVVFPVLAMSILPAAIASLALFDYGLDHDLMAPRPGCNEWVLRMPVPAWKIAIVPIALKTAWVSTLWLLLAFTVKLLASEGGETVPTIGPCISLSAAMLWVMAIAWRPVRNGWIRLGLLMVAAPLLYGIFVGVLVLAQPDNQIWYPAIMIASIVAYASGSWSIYRAIVVGKSAVSGLIPEKGRGETASTQYARRELRHPVRALLWHDISKTKGFIRYTLLLGVLPTILITTFVLPLGHQTIVIVIVLFTYLSAISTGGMGSGIANEAAPSLPPYLAASPLSTATIAWTRLAAMLIVCIAVGSCILFAFAGWSFWDVNRTNWYRWAANQAAAYGSPDQTIAIGVRLSFATMLGAAVIIIGRLASWAWVAMMGRSWVNVVAVLVAGVFAMTAGSIFLHWFMQQTDWETTTASFYRWLSWAPHLVVGLLLVKLAMTLAATVTLSRSHLTSHKTIVTAIGVWGILTLTISGLMATLIPDPRATFLWCLALTTLAIPIARILMQPVSMNLNRHR